MRKEAVYTLLLNATLFRGMRCFLAQDPRYLRFSVLDAGVTTHYNLRVRADAFHCGTCAHLPFVRHAGFELEDCGGALGGDQRAHPHRLGDIPACVVRQQP